MGRPLMTSRPYGGGGIKDFVTTVIRPLIIEKLLDVIYWWSITKPNGKTAKCIHNNIFLLYLILKLVVCRWLKLSCNTPFLCTRKMISFSEPAGQNQGSFFKPRQKHNAMHCILIKNLPIRKQTVETACCNLA